MSKEKWSFSINKGNSVNEADYDVEIEENEVNISNN
jgi:hypothetical protein